MVTSADDVPPSQQIIQKVQDAYQVPWFFFGSPDDMVLELYQYQTYQVIDSKGIISRIHMNQAMCQCVVVQDHLRKGLVLQYGLSALHVLACCQLSRLCIAPLHNPCSPFRKQIVPSWASVPRAFPWNPRSESVVFCNHKKPLIKLWIDLMSPPGIGFWHSGWHFVYFFLPFFWVNWVMMVSSCLVNKHLEDWDEARLKALCARHGWEFEWMTEAGANLGVALPLGSCPPGNYNITYPLPRGVLLNR